MEALEYKNYHIAAPLLLDIKHHTVIESLISGSSSGLIYVNDTKDLDIAIAQYQHHVFISGKPDDAKIRYLHHFLTSEVFDNCRSAGVPFFRLVTNKPSWRKKLKVALEERDPIEVVYLCYSYYIKEKKAGIQIPQGFEIRSVDEKLVHEVFQGKEDLLEEMCSERDTVDDFLAKSFGVAAFKEDELAGWCLSEYNFENRCEVGIATMTPFQRQGLGEAMTKVFLNNAHDHGINTVLWHCYKSNDASRHTALSAGFSLLKEEPVLMVYLDRAINLAVHGNHCFQQNNYHDALLWYQKALSADNPPSWIAWNAACASAASIDHHKSQVELAFNYLNRAIDLGFCDLDRLVSSEYMTSLKGDPRWGNIITRLNRSLPS